MGFGFERISYEDEKQFRKKITSGKKPTDCECRRHLEYIKKYGKSSFANRWNIAMIPHPEGIPHPKGEVYRDDLDSNENKNEIEKNNIHVLKKRFIKTSYNK